VHYIVSPELIRRDSYEPGTTIRKDAYLAALNAVAELTGYHTALLAGAQIKLQPYRTELPEPPISTEDFIPSPGTATLQEIHTSIPNWINHLYNYYHTARLS
jgi:hypothetical protein